MSIVVAPGEPDQLTEAVEETTPSIKPIQPLTLVRNNTALIVVPLIILAGGIWLSIYRSRLLDESRADYNPRIARVMQWDPLKRQIEQHISITVWSTVFVLLVAVPLGILLTRPRYRSLGSPILAVATSGQAVPAFGLLVLTYAWLAARGPWSVIWALTLFTLLPVLRNTMVGLEQVSWAVIEAGRGMGLTKLQTLRHIELPLAVPVILAGVRTALVINVGMTALAFFIGGGGLGVTINTGLQNGINEIVVVGAVLTALLALIIDWVAALVEKALRPSGL